MKSILIAMSAAALLAGCASTSSTEDMAAPMPAADPMSPLSAPGFMAMAASSDMFEIESSRIALQQTRSPAVRQFAQMMIDHHTRTSADLMSTARQAGMTPPPPQLLPPQLAALDRVRMATPADFDATYKREQIAGHQMALDLHRNYAASGDVALLREAAARTAPIVEQHLAQAQTLPDYAPAPATTPMRAGERG